MPEWLRGMTRNHLGSPAQVEVLLASFFISVFYFCFCKCMLVSLKDPHSASVEDTVVKVSLLVR